MSVFSNMFLKFNLSKIFQKVYGRVKVLLWVAWMASDKKT